jgi:hypothetical protein
MRSIRALLFSDRQKLAFVRVGNNKARSSRSGGSKAFSLLSTPKTDHEIILLYVQ